MLAGASPALAGPWWRLSSRVAPTYLPPASNGVLNVSADDLGDTGITGSSSEITITDVLPAGLKVTEAAGVNPHRARVGNRGSAEEKTKFWKCTIGEREVTCATTLAIPPYERLELEIPVTAEASLHTDSSLPNQVSVHGGENEPGGGIVPSASLTRPVLISDQPVPFGIEAGGFSLTPEEEDGSTRYACGLTPIPADEHRRVRPDDRGSPGARRKTAARTGRPRARQGPQLRAATGASRERHRRRTVHRGRVLRGTGRQQVSARLSRRRRHSHRARTQPRRLHHDRRAAV